MTPTIYSYLEQFAYLKRNSIAEQNDNYQLSISYIPTISDIGSDNIEHLNQLYDSLSVLDKVMLPFKNCGIPFELGVTGGAVYDLLTNNTSLVKDYDITLHFPIYPQKEEFEIMNNKFQEDNISFEGKNFDLLSEKYAQPMHQLFKTYMPEKAIGSYLPKDLVSLVKLLLNSNFSNVESFNIKKTIKNYRNEQINGMFKIEDEHFQKSVDLIINKCNTNYFCSTFDFNLCKTYINYIPAPNVNMNQQQIAEHMLKSLFIFPEAARDLNNHTLTMDLTNQSFTLDHIKYFMERHFPRLEEKLPNFRLTFKTDQNTIEEQKQWTNDYWHDYLERKLSYISPSKDKKKLKL